MGGLSQRAAIDQLGLVLWRVLLGEGLPQLPLDAGAASPALEQVARYAAYRNDGHGRAAYEPSMMIALLLYCCARGVRSSRAIERACVEDVACRVLAAH